MDYFSSSGLAVVPDRVRRSQLVNEIGPADLLYSLEMRRPIGRTVFVSNIAYGAGVRDLGNLFTIAGTVVNAYIFKNRFGTSSGKACIEFDESNGAKRAIELLDNQIRFGRKLIVRMHYYINTKHISDTAQMNEGLGRPPNRIAEIETNTRTEFDTDETTMAYSNMNSNDSSWETTATTREEDNYNETPIIVSVTSLCPTITVNNSNQLPPQVPSRSADNSTTTNEVIDSTRDSQSGSEIARQSSTRPNQKVPLKLTTVNDSKNPIASLTVKVKPFLHEKMSREETAIAQKELDDRVKGVLAYNPERFQDWLKEQNLVKPDQDFRTYLQGQNDPRSTTGDRGKQALYYASIFDTTCRPDTILQLIYHWSCQTIAEDVKRWTNVRRSYIAIFYTLLRSACMVALHEMSPLMGGNSESVEIGLVRLETANVESRPKVVEILGAYDRSTKAIRLRVVNPENTTGLQHETESGERVKKMYERPRRKESAKQLLRPLLRWIDKSSTLLIDGSIDKSVLLEMGFEKVEQRKSNVVDNTTPINAKVIGYIHDVLPEMFKNTWSLLSSRLIQQFLDELSWRERWGHSSAETFNTMIKVLAEITGWDDGESFIDRLNRISLDPFREWSARRSSGNEVTAGPLPDISSSNEQANDQIEMETDDDLPPVLEAYPIGAPVISTTNSTFEEPPVLTPQVQVNDEKEEFQPINTSTLKRKIDRPVVVPDEPSLYQYTAQAPTPYRATKLAAIIKMAQLDNFTPPLKKIRKRRTKTKDSSEGSKYLSTKLNNLFNWKANDSTKCLECDNTDPTSDNHFPAYMACLRCRFGTCCRTAMMNHDKNVHPNPGEIHLKASFNVKTADLLEANIYCGCGFGTRNGNEMVRHLHQCGKMTADTELPQEMVSDDEGGDLAAD